MNKLLLECVKIFYRKNSLYNSGEQFTPATLSRSVFSVVTLRYAVFVNTLTELLNKISHCAIVCALFLSHSISLYIDGTVSALRIDIAFRRTVFISHISVLGKSNNSRQLWYWLHLSHVEQYNTNARESSTESSTGNQGSGNFTFWTSRWKPFHQS